MKKFFKTAGISVGSLAILVFLLWLLLPGLPTYFYVKNTYDCCINLSTSPYQYEDVETPDDFVEIECKGISLKAPKELYKKFPDETYRAKSGLYVDKEKNYNTAVLFIENIVEENFSMIDEMGSDKISQKDFEKAMKGMNCKNPENLYELYNLLFNMTLDDFSVFNHKTPVVFRSLAEAKHILWHSYSDNVYPVETENAVGFITLYGQPSEKSMYYSYLIEFFDKENLNSQYSVIIKSTELETVQQIANSADICTQH